MTQGRLAIAHADREAQEHARGKLLAAAPPAVSVYGRDPVQADRSALDQARRMRRW